MIYKGIVRGKVVHVEDQITLPEGTEVEVTIKQGEGEELSPGGNSLSSPVAVVAALDVRPHCTCEDVNLLLQAIRQGKMEVRFQGPFDAEHNS